MRSKTISQGPKRGKKSNLWPSSYQALTDDEKTKVKVAFLAYNKSHPYDPFFEVEIFYHRIYKKGVGDLE